MARPRLTAPPLPSPDSTVMSLEQLHRCRLLFIDGVWKLKLPDGTIRIATGQEVVAILPKLKRKEDV
jgi:hypothetical protein